MRHVAPVRRELGMPTIMNLLGPLTNPAGAARQVVGVADPATLQLVAEALRQLGHLGALVVHGEPGLDELSPLGSTRVIELRGGSLTEYRVSPADFGYEALAPAELAGGEPAANARVLEEVLRGERGGAARAATAMNAGAAIYLAGISNSLAQGIALAEATISEGTASTVLERLRGHQRPPQHGWFSGRYTAVSVHDPRSGGLPAHRHAILATGARSRTCSVINT
jgi:anthranilate phosphoribosyltransferase